MHKNTASLDLTIGTPIHEWDLWRGNANDFTLKMRKDHTVLHFNDSTILDSRSHMPQMICRAADAYSYSRRVKSLVSLELGSSQMNVNASYKDYTSIKGYMKSRLQRCFIYLIRNFNISRIHSSHLWDEANVLIPIGIASKPLPLRRPLTVLWI